MDNDVSIQIGRPALLARRREAQLEQVLKEMRSFSRRADLPEDRIALAEIERELLETRKRWSDAGLLPDVPQLEPAHA